MEGPAIEAIQLHKTFTKRPPKGRKFPFFHRKLEPFVAVKNVTFSVARGEIFGLLGPNGAGKTTTIRMLCGLLEPTSGTARVNGFDTVTHPFDVRRSLGTVLTGERSVYWKLTGRENLEYFAALHGLARRDAREVAQKVLARLDMIEKADELVEKYSSGMRQRIALGKALLAGQPILLLDEPTIGLDPGSARRLRSLVRELRDEGRTILLTTHYMEEADQLCDRVGIIDGGEIIALDSPARLKEQIGESKAIQITVNEWSATLEDGLAGLPGVTRVASDCRHEQGVWDVTLLFENGAGTLASAIAFLADRRVQVHKVQVQEPSLEDVFLKLTGKGLRGGTV